MDNTIKTAAEDWINKELPQYLLKDLLVPVFAAGYNCQLQQAQHKSLDAVEKTIDLCADKWQQPVSLKWLKIPANDNMIRDTYILVKDNKLDIWSVLLTNNQLIADGHTHYIPVSSLLALDKED